ncbi:hypothetical protein [Natribacillus halophilus]|uniref:Cytosolic protein n=1 Tax=Natribacillus halophilus TaxID=549003 RepID=A0A1G8RMZ7_9BACI|nr:hypothetical protein [Natribacillus halophilus]SDJ18361.1 hypothetical protein SAMN04488123_11921 [Natribacillus halophilus]
MPKRNRRENYSDFESVESQQNELIGEEFAEGAYGSPFEETTGQKSTPWQHDQHRVTAFTYENRELHAGGGRYFPQAHKPHSSEDEDNDKGRE